ncbi:sterol desaturase family protein [Aureibaculum sp. A20]|uniref:Sterol desaturase family protein n=1 Tax=Aureibaculum flavum TaxID=2795986 RepID=A0ABS0WLK1_9FLAO|nr:sterol desaturase family protein [Aureibaculum flavum]MBJ2172847.1 sterol desaturase family protein [Aureibaculum flavum]
MESFLQFFEQMPSWQKLVWILACLLFSWFLEGIYPLVKLNYKKWKHAGVNLVFLGTSLTINIVFGLLTIGVFSYIGTHQIGILHWVHLPIWAELFITILFLDFVAQYAVHYYLHKVSWMWRFHMIHHSDTKVDATTGTRHHPGDYVLREIAALIAIVIIGAPFAFYVVYKIVTILFTYLTHANINVPVWIDKPMSFIFITPNMHKFHHHFERPWTDTNFGNIFSFWDRIFGTFVYGNPNKVIYGLDVLDGKLDENVGYQFKIPFDERIKTDY